MTVPIAIGAGRSPFAELRAHLKLDVADEERFASGALAQILKPKRRVTPAWSPTARRERTRSRCIPNSRLGSSVFPAAALSASSAPLTRST